MAGSIERIDATVYEMATVTQREAIDAVRKYGSHQKAANALGVSKPAITRKIGRALARATRQGYSPSHGLTVPYNEGFHLSKATIQRNGQGEVVQVWERMNADDQKHMEMLKLAIEASLEDVTPRKPTKKQSAYSNDQLMVNIPIGDAHIGMLAWGEECGEDYDLQIAEQTHKDAIDLLIDTLPDAHTCCLIDLGDYLHADNLLGVTGRSGNNLDMDGRYHKVVRVAIKVCLYYVEKALQKFERVIYRPEVGNHNDTGAIWVQEWLAVLFSNEPRVEIGNQAGNHFFWQWGLCFFGSHHGHEIKPAKLPEIMACHIMDNNLKTSYRKWYTGHVHHESKKDFTSCEVQTYRTLAPKDAYSASHGYNAPRGICGEVWHKELGHVSTSNVNIPMINTGRTT